MPTNIVETTFVERDQRLARSLLWVLQRAYYERQGVAAWSQATVPHYITNNPLIAGAYARLALAYLRDCQSAGLLDRSQPLYLLELGAGTGRLAFYFLQQFLEGLPAAGLGDLNIIYLLSDLPQRNVDFWKTHPNLTPLAAAGRLDFARYDAMQDEELQLEISGKRLSAGDLANPLIVFANYFFDSIAQDAFYIANGMLSEQRTTLTDDRPEIIHPSQTGYDSELLSHLHVQFKPCLTSPDYYDDPRFNQVLASYLRLLNQGYVQFPSGGMEVLRRLRQLSGDRLLLVASDRGYYQFEDIRSQPEPRIYRHGSAFSMQVNFHALQQYTELCGGSAHLSQHRPEGLVTGAFVFWPASHPLADGRETAYAFQEAIEHGGPDDFFALKKGLEPLLSHFSLDQILALLRLSQYDPNIFEKCSEFLLEQAQTVDRIQQQQLGEAAARVWARHYPIGEVFDLPLALAKIFIALARYPEALECLNSSLHEPGPNPQVQEWIEMCQ